MSISHLLITQLEVRIIQESIERIKKCLSMLSDSQLREKPSDEVLNVEVSIIHLCGNVRQWLNSIVKGEEQQRNRAAEFSPNHIYSKRELVELLEALREEIYELMPELEKIDLSKELTIQGIPTNGVDALVHVIEHFSYHTGQITLLTKYLSGKQTGYYANHNLDE